MRVYNTSFVANRAAIEGPAVMSVGFLDVMYNVNLSENAYYCRAGEYGYIEKNEASTTNGTCTYCSSMLLQEQFIVLQTTSIPVSPYWLLVYGAIYDVVYCLYFRAGS